MSSWDSGRGVEGEGSQYSEAQWIMCHNLQEEHSLLTEMKIVL